MDSLQRDIAIVLLTALYVALLLNEDCNSVCMNGVSTAIAILQMSKTSHVADPHDGKKTIPNNLRHDMDKDA